MELYETEEQQVENLKKWWRENGRMAFIGVVLGLAAFFGWMYWQKHQKNQALQASALYNQLIKAVAENKKDSAAELAERIQSQFVGTDYAAFSHLFLAKLAVQKNDLPAARQWLERQMAHDNKELAHIARIRLVRLMLHNKEYEQGLKVINQVDAADLAGFSAVYDELTGDLYAALGRLDLARTAYQNALRGGQQSPWLQMKIDDLAAPEKAGK